MLPFPKLFNTSLAPTGIGYSDFLLQKDANIAAGKAKAIPFNHSPVTYNANVDQYFYFQYVDGSGSMYGSSFMNPYTWDSVICRIARHAFPDQYIYDSYKANSLWCLVRVLKQKTWPGFPTVTRYGYSSLSFGSQPGCNTDLFVYFDDRLQKMMQWNPYTNSSPVEYVPVFL